MNQLQGEARSIAHDWLVEARRNLEVTQALKVVKAYLTTMAVALLDAASAGPA